MERLRKFLSLTPRERGLLCEASILLLLSNVCVKAIAFRHIERFLRIRWFDDIQSDIIGHEREITVVQRSISRATNVLPWKTKCLSQSITQFIMLRRRGIRAILLAGVRFSGHSSLDAHAWVDTDLATDNKSNENSGFATVIRIGEGR
jgi:Transglutaminase-like superfamily